MTHYNLSRFCITFVEHDSSYVIFFFPEKENLFKRDGETPLFFYLFFSSPLPFFGKEKNDVTGIMFRKSNTKLGKIVMCHFNWCF